MVARPRYHATEVAVGHVVLVSLALFLAQLFYRDYARSLVSLALTTEHSYLVSLLVAVALSIHLSAGFTGLSRGVKLGRLLASLFGLLLSATLCVVSTQNTEYAVQIQGAGLSVAFVSIALLVHETRSPSEALPFLTPLLLVPLPAALTDPVTLALSRAVGGVVAVAGGAGQVESAHPFPGVQTPLGEHGPGAGRVCSGAMVIGSVASALPALAYMVAFSGASARRKLLVALLSLATGLGVGFVGNLAGALVALLVARSAGVEEALNALRYNPSLLYSAASATISFYLVTRRAGATPPRPQPVVKGARDTTWGYASVALLVATVATASAYAALIPAFPGGRATYTVSAGDLGEVFESPLLTLGDSAAYIAHATRDERLARALGALSAYRVEVELGGESYCGYVEVVDTPAKLHTWQLYLALQGFRVTSSWSASVDTRYLGFVVAERGGEVYALAYTLIPVAVKAPGSESVVYVRVSLASPRADSPAAVGRVASALLKLTPAGGGVVGDAYLSAYLIATYIALALLLAYLGIVGTGSVASKLSVKRRVRGASRELRESV